MSDRSAQTHTSVDAASLYWAVLDASVLPRTLTLPRKQLGYLFEATLPVPIEEVHAVYQRLPHQKILACGMARRDMDSLVQSGAITATPQQIPAGFPEGVSTDQLNLLTGEFEPRQIRTIRRRSRVRLGILAVAGVLLLVLRMERRRVAAHEAIEQIDVNSAALYRRLYPSMPGGAVTVQHRARLTSELRSLRKTRGVQHQDDPNAVSRHLEELLGGWLSDSPTRVETVSVSPSLLTVRGTVDDMPTAERLANRLDRIETWSVEPPQLDQTSKGVQFTIRLSRDENREGGTG